MKNTEKENGESRFLSGKEKVKKKSIKQRKRNKSGFKRKNLVQKWKTLDSYKSEYVEKEEE